MDDSRGKIVWALLRLSMGWIFFWAFLDKLFGLGFSTAPNKAWLYGGSPTSGFLLNATKGPFAGFFQSLAGDTFIDRLFMIGLFCVGASLILGIGVRIAGFSGALMLLLMYAAGFLPPQNNPFLDEHLVYAVIMIGLALAKAGRFWGLGNWWAGTSLVKKIPILE